MIVLITNHTDSHADAVIRWLREWHVPFFRLHPEELTSTLTISYHCSSIGAVARLFEKRAQRPFDPLAVKSVWFRRPRSPKAHPLAHPEAHAFFLSECETTISSLYRFMEDAFWINSLPATTRANDKLLQLRVAASLGMKIPATLLTNSPEEALQFYHSQDFQCIVKPFRNHALVEGKRLFTHKLSAGLTAEDFEVIRAAPTLLQRFVDKAADLRVTVVGQEIIACRIMSQAREDTSIDFRKGDLNKLDYEIVPVSESLKCKMLNFCSILGLASCEFDFADVGDQDPIFFECNPNGQWFWIELKSGVPLSQSMAKLLIS